MASPRIEHGVSDQFALGCADVLKLFPTPAGDVLALQHVSVQVQRGEFLAIMGPSGSGKTTLIRVLCGEIPINSGKVVLGTTSLYDLTPRARRGVVRRNIARITQNPQDGIFPYLRVGQNIDFAGSLGSSSGTDPQKLMALCGLADVAHQEIRPLSGGQQQRVCLAMALARAPLILVADEPTGNLDSRSSKELLTLMKNLARSQGQTIVMVTHDMGAAEFADRIIFIEDGRLTKEIVPLASRSEETPVQEVQILDSTNRVKIPDFLVEKHLPQGRAVFCEHQQGILIKPEEKD